MSLGYTLSPLILEIRLKKDIYSGDSAETEGYKRTFVGSSRDPVTAESPVLKYK